MVNKIPNYKGRATFEFILKQLEDCINDIKIFFDDTILEHIYTPIYYKESLKLLSERPNLDLKQLALGDIAYSIVFFGMSHWDLNTFMRLYLGHYNPIFLRYIVFYVSQKPHKNSDKFKLWNYFKKGEGSNLLNSFREDLIHNKFTTSRFEDFLLTYREQHYSLFEGRPYKYYGGHQFKLGHYYRNLYQTTTYINNQNIFCYSEKYEYAKTLRAQLSTPEQYLLFFNSLSKAGREWELSSVVDYKASADLNNYLITKYNMIKNIPDLYFINEIQIQNFYPSVQFEFNEEPESRKKIKTHFK